MIRIRKSCVTLIEVMIAMGLTSILLVALMSVYSQIETAHQEIAKIRKHTFYTLYLQQRLAKVISYAKLEKEAPWFYTNSEYEQPSLVFVYDNGVDGIPQFSGDVLGKLFVDGKRRLILATWPMPENDFSSSPQMRKEVLAEEVEKLAFRFFKPYLRQDGEKSAQQIPEDRWEATWPIEDNSLPPILKMQINTKKETLLFAFVLPGTKEGIAYP